MIKVHATIKLDEKAMERARKMLKGAPKRVHQHRLSVGIHEQEASAQTVKPASQAPQTNRLKMGYRKISDAKLIDVALFHELGLGVPERSWLRSWFDTKLDTLKLEATEAMRSEYEGDAEAVPALAAKWAMDLRAWIENNEASLRPLANSTKRERRAAGLPDDPPLFATGQLVRAIHGLADGEYQT